MPISLVPQSARRVSTKRMFAESRGEEEAIFLSLWSDSRVSGAQKFVALGIVRIQKRRLADKVEGGGGGGRRRGTRQLLLVRRSINKINSVPFFFAGSYVVRASQTRRSPSFRRGDASYSRLNHSRPIDLACLNQRLIPLNESAAPCARVRSVARRAPTWKSPFATVVSYTCRELIDLLLDKPWNLQRTLRRY